VRFACPLVGAPQQRQLDARGHAAAKHAMDMIDEPPATETARTDNGDGYLGFLGFLVKFAVAVLLIRSLFISTYNIPSESMQPRLLIGDYLIASKFAYGWSRHSWPFSPDLPNGRVLGRLPARGDVVVFKAPPGNTQDYIKRVIGLPGDRVQVIDGIVFVNDRAIPRRRTADLLIPVTENMRAAAQGNPCFRENFEVMVSGVLHCRYPQYVETLPNGRSYRVLDLMLGDADTTGIYEVPPGHVFLMGDNRDRSYDSRFPAVENQGIGIVPMDNIVAEAWFTAFSTDGSASWFNPISWFTATRWSRIGQGF
jgi:signal peptidase I